MVYGNVSMDAVIVVEEYDGSSFQRSCQEVVSYNMYVLVSTAMDGGRMMAMFASPSLVGGG